MEEANVLAQSIVLNTDFNKCKENDCKFKLVKKYYTNRGTFYEVLFQNWYDGGETIEVLSEEEFAKL